MKSLYKIVQNLQKTEDLKALLDYKVALRHRIDWCESLNTWYKIITTKSTLLQGLS